MALAFVTFLDFERKTVRVSTACQRKSRLLSRIAHRRNQTYRVTFAEVPNQYAWAMLIGRVKTRSLLDARSRIV